MDDILDARIPLLHSGISIALRDTYGADDSIVVPLEYGGISCKANALADLPTHARVPVLHSGLMLSPTDIIIARPYYAKAVHFDSGTYLTRTGLISVNSAFLSVSYWQRVDPIATGPTQRDIFTGDPDNLGGPSIGFRSPNLALGQVMVYAPNKADDGDSWAGCKTLDHDRTVWNHYLVCIDTNHVGTTKIVACYINDVFDTGVPDNNGVAFTYPFNGMEIGIGIYQFIGDLADVRIMPGVSLLDGAGRIPTATRRLFISSTGKPVDPAIATAALGVPCMLFSGDATGFVTNQGSGGAFTLYGELTDANTSPSGAPIPPAVPYHAPAVHFDGATYISVPSITPGTALGGALAVSMWIKADTTRPSIYDARCIYMFDPTGGAIPFCTIKLPTNASGSTFLAAAGPSGAIELTSSAYNRTGWNHILYAVNGQNGTAAVYINDVFDAGATKQIFPPPFNIPFTGMDFVLGRDPSLSYDYFVGDMADVLIMPNYGLIDSSGHIAEQTRRTFIDAFGKPVAPASDWFYERTLSFSGDATTFAINKGTCGPATLVGPLTNATTSPSD